MRDIETMSMGGEDGAKAKTASRGRPKKRSDEARQEQILAAAMSAFIDKGFARATMSDIARQAGMSKRDLYKQFSDKQALFAATIESRRHLILGLPRPDGETLPLRDLLRRVFRLDLDARHADERDTLMALIHRESLMLPTLNALLYDGRILQFRETLVVWLKDEMQTGRVAQAQPERVAGMMLDLVFGVLLPKRRPTVPVDRHLQAEEILDRLEILLAGLVARSAQKPV
ncbi:helix-turn-helix domain-containing protein (plasmid) [Thioclava litoralis]|uniref:Helix-turn-helix domain-containing protein n=1 Tax=Thioclava litoralis TaxID=3076557 RepID=A0ABZ1E6B2_9RHOB|nr:helix-turn-helix domain-containing protein [Thioclava sp. FTW29]